MVKGCGVQVVSLTLNKEGRSPSYADCKEVLSFFE